MRQKLADSGQFFYPKFLQILCLTTKPSSRMKLFQRKNFIGYSHDRSRRLAFCTR